MTIGLAAQAGAALGAINVEEETIREIVKILTENADDVDRNSRPKGVAPAVFGASDPGQQFGHHVNLAHQHVTDAMRDLVAGLEGYVVKIHRFHDDMVFTDETSGDGSRRSTDRVAGAPVPTLEAVESCTAPPDFSNNTCEIPAEED
ncbi:hypothetical protein [Nocardioides sp. 1609]|uniref:hypothetical protein n=1 Tax=Nocardioides sp. 1609 TaxID=2508327 RepID=UPI00106FAF34|nr:hypothetical protein [Nocardioides sp. 1609]